LSVRSKNKGAEKKRKKNSYPVVRQKMQNAGARYEKVFLQWQFNLCCLKSWFINQAIELNWFRLQFFSCIARNEFLPEAEIYNNGCNPL